MLEGIWMAGRSGSAPGALGTPSVPQPPLYNVRVYYYGWGQTELFISAH